MIWKRRQFNAPAQVGWHSGPFSIYARNDYGPCVLSSGEPYFFGPEHFGNVSDAMERAEEFIRARAL